MDEDKETGKDVDEEDSGEELDEVDQIADEEEEEDKGLKDLFQTPILDKAIENPEIILETQDQKETFENSEKVREYFHGETKKKPAIHPGFVSTYSFGENEFERLKLMLFRLDEVAEMVMTYKKENLYLFPEYYSIVSNFYHCIRFIIDSTNREKILKGLEYVKANVIDFTTNKSDINTIAIEILHEIHSVLMDIKNFHGLGFSYEKKKGESEKYYESFFKKRKVA